MQKSWVRPALRGAQARRDFRDLVELCGLSAGGYRVVADETGTAVEPAATADGFTPQAEQLLARAYALAAGDRPVQEDVRYECTTTPRPPPPGGATQFVRIGPGLFAGGATVAELLRRLDDLFRSMARQVGATEYVVPHLISWEALRRAGYVAAFPQHLTACYSVRRDLNAVDELSRAGGLRDGTDLMEPQDACLAPAACYHLYPLLAGTTVEPGAVYTVVAPCSRRELRWTPEPIRLWSFRMREIVHVGSAQECVGFRDRQLELVAALARELSLPCRLVSANDPFYTSARTGQVSLQNLLGLKYELVSRDADGNEFATTSINLHRDHLGQAFDMCSAGRPAHTACVGFGLERWAHWILSHCGPQPSDWPVPLQGSPARGGPGRRDRAPGPGDRVTKGPAMGDTTNGTAPSRADLRRSILEFLATANRRQSIDPSSLTDDDNLFDMGLVDSLTLAELLVMVERLSRVELDLLTVEPETLFTLRGLLDYVEGLHPAASGDPR